MAHLPGLASSVVLIRLPERLTDSQVDSRLVD
jgi:hypothetical protein